MSEKKLQVQRRAIHRSVRSHKLRAYGDMSFSMLLIGVVFVGAILLVFGVGSRTLSKEHVPVTPTPTMIPPTPKPYLDNTNLTVTPYITASPTPSPTTPVGPPVAGCGSTVSPGVNLATALANANGVLCLHGGTYSGSVTLSKSGAILMAAPGERPVLSGQIVFSGSDMTIDGLNFTWNSSMNSSQHMVKITGVGITMKNGEIWGAHSYAGLLISGGASNFLVQNMVIHDTYPSNSTNQDHLIYVDNASNGVIERSLFYNSSNGRGIKLGPPSGSGGPRNVVIRYNTFYNNTGPSNIQLSGDTSNITIDHNILQKSSIQSVTVNGLNGSGNVVKNNLYWESTGLIEPGGGIQDGGGNLHVDPQLQFTNGYRPGNMQAANYGRYAP